MPLRINSDSLFWVGGVLLPPSLYLTCERNGEWRGWLGLSPAFIPLMIFRGLLPCRCIQSKQSRPGAFFSIPVMEWNAVCMVHVRNSPSWKTNNIRRFHVLLLCFYSRLEWEMKLWMVVWYGEWLRVRWESLRPWSSSRSEACWQLCRHESAFSDPGEKKNAKQIYGVII